MYQICLDRMNRARWNSTIQTYSRYLCSSKVCVLYFPPPTKFYVCYFYAAIRWTSQLDNEGLPRYSAIWTAWWEVWKFKAASRCIKLCFMIDCSLSTALRTQWGQNVSFLQGRVWNVVGRILQVDGILHLLASTWDFSRGNPQEMNIIFRLYLANVVFWCFSRIAWIIIRASFIFIYCTDAQQSCMLLKTCQTVLLVCREIQQCINCHVRWQTK